MNPERRRLDENGTRLRLWQQWGSHLGDRAWGTMREDYSACGMAWDYVPHDHARSRAFRWSEDRLLASSIAIRSAASAWRSGTAAIRSSGLTGSDGNHGEDVKESYATDTPSASRRSRRRRPLTGPCQ